MADMAPRLLQVLIQPTFVMEVDGNMVSVQGQQLMSEKEWKSLEPAKWAEESAKAAAGKAREQRLQQSGIALPGQDGSQ